MTGQPAGTGNREGKTHFAASILDRFVRARGAHRGAGYLVIKDEYDMERIIARSREAHAARQRLLPERDPQFPRGPGNCGCAHPLCLYCYPLDQNTEPGRTCRCQDPAVFGHGCGR